MKSYVGRRPVKQIQDSFTRGEMTTVDEFVERNFRPEPATGVTPSQTLYSELTRGSSLLYLNDNGDGRISDGLKSLEAITKVLKGIPASAMVLFDQVIYTNPYTFRDTTDAESIDLVIQNLGLAPFVAPALAVSPNSIKALNELSLRMSKDIKNGTFTFNKYLNETLRTGKTVVKAGMNYKAI